jgi:hypothetical protein
MKEIPMVEDDANAYASDGAVSLQLDVFRSVPQRPFCQQHRMMNAGAHMTSLGCTMQWCV